MAKKKGARKARGVGDFDDGSSSVSSSCASALPSLDGLPGGEEEEIVDSGSVLDGFVDALYEKRGTTREAGLRGLAAALAGGVLLDFAEEKHETLQQLFLTRIRKGGAAEAALAARGLGLLVVTLGAGEKAEHTFTESTLHLTKLANQGSGVTARIAAVEVLSILCFVAATDNAITESTMHTVWQIAGHRGGLSGEQKSGVATPPPPLRAAALSAWSLLLTTLPSGQRLAKFTAAQLPFLAKLLKEADVGVRSAAGEAIALLHEMNAEGGLQEGTIESSEEVVAVSLEGALERTLSGSFNKPLGDKHASVVEAMRELSVEGARWQSKKDKVAQRSTFRELVCLVDNRGCSPTKIKLKHGDTLVVGSWAQTVQLKAMRRFLAEGFQAHLQENPLMHQVFQFQPRAVRPEKLSRQEKRLFVSANSAAAKARTQQLAKSRSHAQAAHFSNYDSEG